MKQAVISLLISTEGELILQQRDDKPNITDPGMIVNFGGSLEEGEEPINGIIREIYEELTIKLNKEDFQLLESLVAVNHLNREKYLRHLFIAHNIKKQDLILEEGEAIIYLKYNESFGSLPVSETTKKILEKYKKLIEPKTTK